MGVNTIMGLAAVASFDSNVIEAHYCIDRDSCIKLIAYMNKKQNVSATENFFSCLTF